MCTPNATNVVWSHCQCVLADGVERGILTANRMLPGPSIQVCENDKVVIDVENHMEGMEVTIHWHGIWQRGSQYYDGVPFVTQCPIQQGNTFRYTHLRIRSWYLHKTAINQIALLNTLQFITDINGKVTQVPTSGTLTLVSRSSTVYTAVSSFVSLLPRTPTVTYTTTI